MQRKHLDRLAAVALSATVGVATPALALGGMHGGGFGGGMHSGGFSGVHSGGFSGVHSGGAHFAGGFHGGTLAGRGAFVGHRFANGSFRFHHRHFNNVVVVGAPFGFYGGYGYDDGCWRNVWTSYGWQWVDLCNY